VHDNTFETRGFSQGLPAHRFLEAEDGGTPGNRGEEAGAGVAAAARKLTAATAVVLSRTAVAVGQAVAGWTAETVWGRSVALETAALA